MLNKFSLLVVLVILAPGVHAQLERVGTPMSWTQSVAIDFENEILAQPDVQSLLGEDAMLDEDRSSTYRFAFARQVNWNLMNSGTWVNLPNGDRLWMLSIEYPGAYSISVTLDNLHVPHGGKLYIYSEDHQDYLGPITEAENRDFELGLPHIKGSKIIAEYYEPSEQRGRSNFTIAQVAGSYRSMATEAATLAPCQELVEFHHASVAMSNASASVVRILMDHGQRYATGVLVNNASNDATPYVLMAADAVLGSPGSFVFQFEYTSVCLNSVENCSEKSICGAELRVLDQERNVALLQLLKKPKSDWGAFYSGWRLTESTGNRFRCVQHAKGLPQTMTVYGGEFMPVLQDEQMMHGLSVLELGQTDAGSVGSPIFDDDWNLIGLFRGGNARCNGIGGMDRFVLMNEFWSEVRTFLDPGNRDTDKIPGLLPTPLEASPESINGLVVYPNPACERFSLTCESAETIHSIELMNAQGALVKSFKQVSNLAIGDLPVGVYTVRVQCASGVHALPLFISAK